MNTGVNFQMLCGDCGSLGIKIENPERASREAVVYCADCGAQRGTMGALRDLAVRTETLTVLPIKGRVPTTKSTSAIVAQHIELQSPRRGIKVEEPRRK
jgi:hypothetical protein